ncbi:MAG: phosphatase PAP2 family protein [Salinibacter sp.]
MLFLLLAVEGPEGRAQTIGGTSAHGPQSRFCAKTADRSLDRRGLALVYCESPSGVALSLEAAHTTARPVFYGAVPAAWAGAALTQNQSAVAAAYRLTLTQGLSYGLIVGAKHAVGRSRPYVDLSLEARSERHNPPAPGDAHLSFPSGHAGLSAALATSWSLSYPRWYVIGGGAVWATGVALSRVYLGVHYPSDVLVGAALGAGVAVLIHQLRAIITPSPLRETVGAQRMRGVPVVLRLQF